MSDSESKQWLCIAFVTHILFICAISFSLGGCLSAAHCPATALITGKDLKGLSDIFMPILTITGYLWNVIHIYKIWEALKSLGTRDVSEAIKRS